MSGGGGRPRHRWPLLVAALVPLAVVIGLVWRATSEPAGEPAPTGTAAPQTPATVPPGERTVPPGEKEAGERRGEGRTDKPLAGRTVVIDPGHNPTNHRHPDAMSRQVDVGTHHKNCDTTGTATASGYAEAEFTLDVSRRIRAELEERGATVVLTHDGDRPWGPCVDERATIGNEAEADAAVSVHADGAGAGNRGFHVIAPEPVNRGRADTRAVVGPSRLLGEEIVTAFGRATGTDTARYAGGGDGLDERDDLGGLNLSTVPKVFLECGNMRDPRDAALLTDPAWRQRAAHGVVEGLTAFLTGESGGGAS